ncbi:putative Protein CLP1-like protein [Hypsibius exemplaris]|uniref:Protein CLP1 homolog n=1 Tax=Hypsibius exemplaris TaxID=2072580 RepID=A0A1W0WWQ3_HYPEX|nr:putative Protein CLP1-like protein [Hypsibius exemplaris]
MIVVIIVNLSTGLCVLCEDYASGPVRLTVVSFFSFVISYPNTFARKTIGFLVFKSFGQSVMSVDATSRATRKSLQPEVGLHSDATTTSAGEHPHLANQPYEENSAAPGEEALYTEEVRESSAVEFQLSDRLTLSERVRIPSGGQIALSPPYKCSAQVTLLDGECEMFGANLTPGKVYEFIYPQRSVMASFAGCQVFVRKSGYIEPTTVILGDPYPDMVGWIHAVLEEQRLRAEASQQYLRGPAIMVTGPMDSAKSSTCRTLLQYAIAAGWHPTFVDLDAGQQGISLPGMFSMAIMDSSTEAHPERGAMTQRYVLPLGKINMNDDTLLCRQQGECLAKEVQRSLDKARHLESSGVIINTAGWIDRHGFISLTEFAEIFHVNLILVMDDAHLGHRFKKWIAETEQDIEILYCHKPVSLALRTIEARRDYRDHVVKSAFCLPDGSPTQWTIVPLNKLIFYQIASFHNVELRNGKKIAVCNQVSGPSTNLSRVLAISSATTLECDVKSFRVLGFAVLLRFSTPANQAWIVSTMDLNRVRGQVILLRTEVMAGGIRHLYPKEELFAEPVPTTRTPAKPFRYPVNQVHHGGGY